MYKSVVAVIVLIALVAGGVYLLSTGGMSPPDSDVAPSAPRPSAGTVGGEASTGYVLPTVTPEEAYKRWKADPAHTVLLDVRTPEEYQKWNIPGAVHVSVADKDFGVQVENRIPDKNTELFIFCRTGRRCDPAAGILAPLGYKKMHNMGGIIDWPFETAGSDT